MDCVIRTDVIMKYYKYFIFNIKIRLLILLPMLSYLKPR